MSKKLNADAPSFSFNPAVKAWSPGTSFDPASMNVAIPPPTSTPAATPVDSATTTAPAVAAPAAETGKAEVVKPQDGGPKPVEPKTPIWIKKAAASTNTESSATVEPTPVPDATPPTTFSENQQKPSPPPKANEPVEVTFGEFQEKKDTQKTAAQPPVEKPASEPIPTPVAPVVEEIKPEAPVPPAPVKATGWGAQSFASIAKAAPAVVPPRPTVAKAPAAAANQSKEKSGKDSNKKDRRDRKNKKEDNKRADDHSRNKHNDKSSNKSKQEPTKHQPGKQQPSKQASVPKQSDAPKAQPSVAPKASEPAPKVTEPSVVKPQLPVEGAPRVATFAAKAKQASQIPVTVKKISAPTQVSKTVPASIPPKPERPKVEVPAPTPPKVEVPKVEVPAPTPAKVEVPKVEVPAPTKVEVLDPTPPNVEAEPASVKPPVQVAAPPEAVEPKVVAAPAAQPTERKPVTQEDNWRNAPVRSLRPGGARAEGLGGMDRSANPVVGGDKSPANGEGRWGRVTLPPAPDEDPSANWAEQKGGVRHTLFALLAFRTLATAPPSDMNLEMSIVHLYEHKVAEEDTRRAAADRDNKGGRGPLRPKGPPKQYEKPKWAAGTMEGEEAEVMRKALFILNKLTVEKFQKLSEEFLNVGFTSVALLEGAIDIIVDKAQMEHHFGAMYANLCLMLAKNPLAELGEADKGKQFKKSLLERCQKEFEKNQKEILEKLNEIEEKDEREAQILVVRKRYLGHMKFVGQLFRVQLLSDKIMHICVQELFGDSEDPDEEKIQCLCTLLSTIGGQLEASAMNKAEKVKLMKKYLKDIKGLSTNQKISSRIRFMCKDLLEMRENGWNSRREEESAKTIAQIHQDANREQGGKGKGGGTPRAGGGNSSPRSGNNGRGGGSSPRAGNQPQDVRASAADSEWTSIKPTSRNNKRNPSTNTVTPTSSSSREKAVSGGGFNAFAEKEKKDRQEKKEKKERKEKEREAKEAKRAQKESVVEAASPFKMTVDQYSNSCKTEFEQHINGGSVSEVIESMKEFGSPVPVGHVSNMINVVLNYLFTTLATDIAVTTGCSLLIELIQQKIIDSSAVEAGLTKFLENFEDYVCDAPKAEVWLPQIMARLVEADMITLQCFVEAGGLMKEGWKLEEFFGFSTKFLVKTLAACNCTQSKKSSSDLLQEAKLDIRVLAENNEELDKLLVEHKVTL